MATNLNVWSWSATAADNATADASISWPEGQDPATVNDSARGMMAAIAKMTDVQSGNVGTVGSTANAIVIQTGQTISSGHQALGFRICFQAAATNTGATTVAVDGLSAVAIKRPNGDALSAGDIVSGGFHDIAFDGTNYRLLAATGAAGTYGTLSGGNTWTGSNLFIGSPITIGDTDADAVYLMGTRVSTMMALLMGTTSVAALRTAMGLGTAATQNTGASGANVPLMNVNNTWSGNQTIATNTDFVVPLYLTATNATSGSGPFHVAAFLTNLGAVCGTISTNASALTTSYNTSSDRRLKRDITPLADSGSVIDQLTPVRFRWNHGNNDADFGFIAQDLHEVVPQAVTPGRGNPGEANFIPWGMQKGALEAILVAEIKALRARVAALEAAS